MIANPIHTIVYLHGFRSASASRKARELAGALANVKSDWEYITPNLSPDPNLAFEQIERILTRCRHDQLTLVGSSLGGFYALVFAQRIGCRAVLLNPSLRPFETLAQFLGPQTNLYTNEAFELTTAHLEFLRRAEPPQLQKLHNTLVIVELGDTLLDHRQTLAALDGARQLVVDGGEHDLASFPSHLDALLSHAGLARSSS